MESDRSTFDKQPILFIGLPCMIIGMGLFLYLSKFGCLGISNSQEIWGQFGDYMNFWVSAGSLVAIVSLTYHIHKKEEKDNAANIDREDALSRPYIIFLNNNDSRYCLIKNIGNGPALNIKASYKPRENGQYVYPIDVDPLGAGDMTEYRELRDWEEDTPMVVVYSDVRGKMSTTFYKKHQNSIVVGQDEFSELNQYYSYASRPSDPDSI